jgi:AAA+ ATPase superfamily predicted ATPase
MQKIIGRKKEIELLSDYINSDKAEFVVVYGRRRIGKTFLIKEFFKNKFTFYMSGAENSTTAKQLVNFTNALNEYSNIPYPSVSDWQSAFAQLKHFLENVKSNGRIVVFFDELPWFDNKKSGFVSAFECFWNTYASSNPKIFLVTCGSSTSWMNNKILKNRGGLHNRVTRQIFLEQFSLHETELFLKSKNIVMDRFQMIECYMILGGIPYYLEQLNRKYSLYQNIDKLFFEKNAILKHEFYRILSSLYSNYEKHIKIIEALSRKRKGLLREEITRLTKISDGGGLTRILEELELCGFIAINSDFATPKKNRLYQLVDFLSLFYLNFVKNEKIKKNNFWANAINSPKHTAWTGYSFELVCQAHLPQILKKLSILGVITYTSSWRSKKNLNGVQIDMLIDRDDNIVNLCEMKYSRNQFTITNKYDMELKNKVAVFIEETSTKKSVHLTMLTTCGLVKNQYWGNIQSEITMEDLFAS